MNIRSITRGELSEILAILPASRRDKVLGLMTEDDRLRSIAAGLLALYTLSRFDLPDELIRYDETGKPYVEGHPSLSISLSHSGDYAVSAFSNSPISIDIQEHEGGRESIIKTGFTAREQEYCNAAENAQERKRRFYQIWCKKECRMKQTAYRHLKEIDTFSRQADFRYYHIPMEGYEAFVYCEKKSAPGIMLDLEYSFGKGFSVVAEEHFSPA